eukprot:gene27568-34010_t
MDNYVDIRGLGRGRYGTARLVRKRTDGRLYAIKKIPFLEDEDRMKALHEAEVLKRLSHQHVVAYMDSFEYEDAELGACLAIVCEYCEEGDLFKRVKHAAKTETPFDQAPTLPAHYDRRLNATIQELLQREPSRRPNVRDLLNQPWVQQACHDMANNRSRAVQRVLSGVGRFCVESGVTLWLRAVVLAGSGSTRAIGS